MTTVTRRPPHQAGLGVATSSIINLLLEATGPVTFEQLETAAGRNATRCMYTAIRWLERDYGQVWRTVRGQRRLERLTAAESVGDARKRVRGVKRAALRTVTVLASADTAALTQDQKNEHAILSAVAASAAVIADRPTRTALAARAEQLAPLDIAAIVRGMVRQ